MSTEVRPVGVSCNIRCEYCYETNLRDEAPVNRYDREEVLKAIDKLEGPWSLFGGEPLILNIRDIDELLELGFKKNGSTGIQTNGNLITPAHIELFRKYKTSVGISLDGPEELNDIRWAGTLEATRKHTDRSMWAIRALCKEAKNGTPHLRPSIIATIHSGNISKEHFPRFVEWLHELDELGVQWLNIHLMEMDHKAGKWFLPPEEVADRLIDLWNEDFKSLKVMNFDEILKLLQGNDDVVCVWHPCDPWNTQAVKGVENDGSPSHCSRTNKDGINWLPAEGTGYGGKDTNFIGHPGTRNHERQLALYVTPQENGGCKGCPYWLLCFGQCPGTGENNDWRMKTSHCLTLKRLFAEGERRLKLAGIKPFTEWQSRVRMETIIYSLWAEHKTVYLKELIDMERKERQGPGFTYARGSGGVVHGDAHGDHTDTSGHGDQHGDAHGDSY